MCYNIPIFNDKGVNMSNQINTQILEGILDDVSQMPTSSILHELEGEMHAGVCDSFDERVAFTDRDVVIEKLVNKRFNELSEAV